MVYVVYRVYLVYPVHCPTGLLGSATPSPLGVGSTVAFPVKGLRASCASPLDRDPWPLCCEGCRGEGVVTNSKNTDALACSSPI